MFRTQMTFYVLAIILLLNKLFISKEIRSGTSTLYHSGAKHIVAVIYSSSNQIGERDKRREKSIDSMTFYLNLFFGFFLRFSFSSMRLPIFIPLCVRCVVLPISCSFILTFILLFTTSIDFCGAK